jgi:hypothetical protein
MGMSPRKRPVELHIEELVLEGFDPRDRHRIGDAVERELARLVLERGISPSLIAAAAGSSVDRMNAGSFLVEHGARAESSGVQIARAVFSGIGQTRGVK